MNNIDATYYKLKYPRPTSVVLSEISQTEYGRFAIIHWAEDIVKSYCGRSSSYSKAVNDILSTWLPEDLHIPYTIDDMEHLLCGLDLYEEDNRWRLKYPTFDKEIDECFIEWICISEEIFNE